MCFSIKGNIFLKLQNSKKKWLLLFITEVLVAFHAFYFKAENNALGNISEQIKVT